MNEKNGMGERGCHGLCHGHAQHLISTAASTAALRDPQARGNSCIIGKITQAVATKRK